MNIDENRNFNRSLPFHTATESVETSSVEQTRTSQEMVTLLSDEANAVEATGFQTELPGLLEDSTQLIQGRIIE